MNRDNLYRAETSKSPAEFASDFSRVSEKHGFVVTNAEYMDMARSFADHRQEVSENFDLHMIQVCKPEKASKSLESNPERAILMPKFIMAFTRAGKTQLRFLGYGPEDIRALVEDEVFPDALAESYRKIIAMIEEAKCGIS